MIHAWMTTPNFITIERMFRMPSMFLMALASRTGASASNKYIYSQTLSFFKFKESIICLFDDSMTVFNGWSDSKGSVLPIYKKLIAGGGLRIWVYR